MKFICNNCGFSAEIPEKRENCPMCASNNVSVKDGPGKETKQNLEQRKIESNEEIPEEKEMVSAKKEDGERKEKITLTDNFFDQKPNKEEQEIADVLKELYPDEEKKGSSFKLPDWKVLTGIGAAVFVVLIVLVISFSSDDPEDEALDDIEDVEETEEVVEEKVEDPAEIEQKEVAANEEKEEPVAKVEEREPQEEVESEEVAAVEEPVKKVAEEKKKPAVKKRRVKPKKRVAKKKRAPRKKKKNTGQKFNDFVQAGHKALGQKRYTDALHEYKNAMRLRPRNGKVYKFIGIAYAYMQNQNQACKNYRKYIQLTPNAQDKAQVQAFLEACP